MNAQSDGCNRRFLIGFEAGGHHTRMHLQTMDVTPEEIALVIRKAIEKALRPVPHEDIS